MRVASQVLLYVLETLISIHDYQENCSPGIFGRVFTCPWFILNHEVRLPSSCEYCPELHGLPIIQYYDTQAQDATADLLWYTLSHSQESPFRLVDADFRPRHMDLGAVLHYTRSGIVPATTS